MRANTESMVVPAGSPGPLSPTWTIYNFIFALQNAAEFLENEQWPEVGEGVQAAANMEAAKRIRKGMDRLVKKHFGGWS